ncbi:hypothetical protein [Streptomyces canus]|uniref:hypothetical protein n=1 Tax=Streptomyces canus TaxID=58343 RepID=UPI0033B6CF9C
MNDVRGWIEKKLAENRFSATRLPKHQLQIARDHFPDARVLCVGLDQGEVFGIESLDSALVDVPGTSFVVVVPAAISHGVYERAEELGVCVTGFGELISALRYDEDVARHVDRQGQYERRRLTRNRAVKSVKRKGYRAYEIQREKLRPLTIVTTDDYEITADRMYSLLEDYEEINPNLIVVTNPNCRGFSTESLQTAARSGIPLVLFNDFLDDLGSKWT